MHSDSIGDLIHLYEDGQLSRRDVIARLTRYTGSLAAALAALASAGLAEAQIAQCPTGVRVPESDPSVFSQLLAIHGEAGPLYVYQSLPSNSSGKRLPAVLVVHENRGLTDYIKDVTRRIAAAGYVGLAVDLLSRQGGTANFPDAESAGAAYSRTRPDERRSDMLSALMTIRDQSYVQGDRLAAIGFCAGGGNVWDLVQNTNLLSAAAVYYGTPVPNAEQVARINTPVLAIYAELDRNITAALGPAIQALASGNKRFEVHIYGNAAHAFHNDTGARYDPAAACDAWAKTLTFFARHLNRP